MLLLSVLFDLQVEKHMKDNAANNTSPPSSVSSPLTPPQHAANAAAATQ